jgi:hypothetical protein
MKLSFLPLIVLLAVLASTATISTAEMVRGGGTGGTLSSSGSGEHGGRHNGGGVKKKGKGGGGKKSGSCDDEDPPCGGVDCDDGNLCTMDFCHPVNDICVSEPVDCGENEACDITTGNCEDIQTIIPCVGELGFIKRCPGPFIDAFHYTMWI